MQAPDLSAQRLAGGMRALAGAVAAGMDMERSGDWKRARETQYTNRFASRP
jgi:hypothetical protein